MSTISLQLHVPRDRIEATSDPQRVMEIINSEMEFSWNLFATEQWIIVTVVHPNGPNADRTRGLQFYTHGGDFIEEVAIEEFPVAVRDNRIIFIRPVEDPSIDYGYEVEYREFAVE